MCVICMIYVMCLLENALGTEVGVREHLPSPSCSLSHACTSSLFFSVSVDGQGCQNRDTQTPQHRSYDAGEGVQMPSVWWSPLQEQGGCSLYHLSSLCCRGKGEGERRIPNTQNPTSGRRGRCSGRREKSATTTKRRPALSYPL